MTGAADEPSILAGATVLVVEDDPPSARLARMLLREAGCDVHVATTAAEAARLVIGGLKPAVVVMDLGLPDLTGLDLTKVFRSLDATRDVPIIAVTASGLAFGQRAAFSAGCDGFVRKPLDGDSFVQVVAGFVRRGRTVRLDPPPASPPPPALDGRHEAILAAMPKAMCVVRPDDLTILYVNRSLERLSGYPAAELVGQPFTLAGDQGGHGIDDVRNDLRRQLTDRGEATFEAPRQRPDGAALWIEATLSRLDDPELGELWLLAFDDITRRKQADDDLVRALARSEHRFATLADAGIIAIATTDPSGRLLDANELFLALIGWSRGEVEAGLVRVSDYTIEALDATVVPLETEYRRKDGQRVPVLVGGRTLDGGSCVVYAIDLSEKRRDQAALRTSQQRFDALWRSGTAGVVIADSAGRVHDANASFLALLGFSREDLAAGLDYRALTPPEYAHQIVEAIQSIQLRGFAEPRETEILAKDGRRVPVLVGIAGIDDQLSVAIITDLSARKLAEEQLHNTETQLRHAQKMEAVGRLAGGVAHDFNNALTVIVSYSEMLLEDLAADDPIRGDLEEMQRAAIRAGELTRQLLLFSRQSVAEPRVMDANVVLIEMDRMLQRLLGEDIDLVSLPGRGLDRVRLDPSHLEQVIVNLAVNARDAMPDGGKLTIETANVELDGADAAQHLAAAGHYVLLTVTDTGCGMSPETLARSFDPFFTTKPAGKGTGLGLSIVFGIVQKSGGHIRVESAPGAGTTFRVYLPRVDDAVEPATPPLSARALRGTETILLVEDDDQVRRVALGILRRSGYTVLEAHSAAEALAICERPDAAIDLLLTDVVMPHMSGLELARRVAVLRAGIRIVCMSGYTDEDVTGAGVLGPGVALLQKPLTPYALARRVRTVLDAPRPG